MRSRRVNIWSGLSSNSISFATLEQAKAVLGVCDHVFTLALYKDTRELIFSNIERVIWLFILKQIKQLFIVNLQERAINCKFTVAIFVLNLITIKRCEYVLNRPRYNTKLICITEIFAFNIASISNSILITRIVIPMRAKHGVSLTRTSLSISKYSRVEAMKHFGDIVFHETVDVVLKSLLSKHSIVFTFYQMLAIGNFDAL